MEPEYRRRRGPGASLWSPAEEAGRWTLIDVVSRLVVSSRDLDAFVGAFLDCIFILLSAKPAEATSNGVLCEDVRCPITDLRKEDVQFLTDRRKEDIQLRAYTYGLLVSTCALIHYERCTR